MAVTTIDIDTEILRELKKSLGIRTNKDVVAFALRETLMRRKQLSAIEAIASMELDPDPQRISYGE